MTVGQKEDRNHSLQNCDVIGQADKLYKPWDVQQTKLEEF